jgi:PadR family transcriptional regulator, regulatory protein PadR
MAAMTNKRNQRDFVNGVPELLLLRLLSHRPMYGYELVQAIRYATDQALDFGEGCVYPLLHRLESQQMLCGRRQVVNGRSRVVYRLTDKGHRQLDESAAMWKCVAEAVNQVLQGEWHGQPAAI